MNVVGGRRRRNLFMRLIRRDPEDGEQENFQTQMKNFNEVGQGCCIATACGGVTLYVITFVICIYARVRMENIKDNFTKLYDSWQSDLVFDVVDNRQHVTAPNEYLQPWQGYFPGTMDGCYCSEYSYFWSARRGLKMRICNYTESMAGCDSLYARPAKPLDTWINNEHLYVIKIRGTSFLETYTKMNLDGSCADGYKHCGSPSSASKGVCIPSSIGKCPITSAKGEKADHSTELKLTNFSMWISRDESHNPIADVNITESHLCLVRTDFPVSVNRPRFPLLYGYSENCQPDLEADSLTEMGERALFDMNGVNYQGLTSYDVSNAYMYHLTAGRQLEWSPACKEMVPSLLSNTQRAEEIYRQYTILFILFICGMIVIFFGVGMTSGGCGDVAVACGIFLVLVSIALVVPSFVIIQQKSTALLNDLRDVENRKCTSEFSTKSFIALGNSYNDKVIYKNTCSLWIGVVSVSLLFLLIVLFCGCMPFVYKEEAPAPVPGRPDNVYERLPENNLQAQGQGARDQQRPNPANNADRQGQADAGLQL